MFGDKRHICWGWNRGWHECVMMKYRQLCSIVWLKARRRPCDTVASWTVTPEFPVAIGNVLFGHTTLSGFAVAVRMTEQKYRDWIVKFWKIYVFICVPKKQNVPSFWWWYFINRSFSDRLLVFLALRVLSLGEILTETARLRVVYKANSSSWIYETRTKAKGLMWCRSKDLISPMRRLIRMSTLKFPELLQLLDVASRMSKRFLGLKSHYGNLD